MLTKTYFRRKLAQACGLGLVLCAAAACAPQQNVLTKEEIADGWQLLFDGKTLDQWKDYNGEELTMPWHVVDVISSLPYEKFNRTSSSGAYTGSR